MAALTSGTITEINEIVTDRKAHPTTVAYIQSLMDPYVKGTSSLNIFDNWVNTLLAENAEKIQKGDVGDDWTDIDRVHAESARQIGLFLNGAEWNWDIFETDRRLIASAKQILIESVVAEFLVLAGDIAREFNDNNILPWDVQYVIIDDRSFRVIFDTHRNLIVKHELHELPVTVMPGPRQLDTFFLNEDFVAGLLLFSDPRVGNRDFQVTMFGAPFTSYYIAPRPQTADYGNTRFDYKNQVYSVMIGGKKYGFNNVSFMQGFATGAQWVGVDHHAYWSQLMKHSISMDGVRTETPITF